MQVAQGRRIRALRRLKRVTQQKLAEKLGISAALLSYIERGLKKPTPQLLEKIAQKLNVTREELFVVREGANGRINRVSL